MPLAFLARVARQKHEKSSARASTAVVFLVPDSAYRAKKSLTLSLLNA